MISGFSNGVRAEVGRSALKVAERKRDHRVKTFSVNEAEDLGRQSGGGYVLPLNVGIVALSNQSSEPTTTAVTIPADAGLAPAAVVAHL